MSNELLGGSREATHAPEGGFSWATPRGAALTYRGAYDAAVTDYVRADIVSSGGALYVRRAASRPLRADDFRRVPQVGFGRARDGTLWEVLGTNHLTSSIAHGRGLLGATSGALVDRLSFGPAVTESDLDILVQFSVETSTDAADGLTLEARQDTSLHGTSVALGLDGSLAWNTGSDTDSGTWDGAAEGDLVWARLTLRGATAALRVWLDGDDEPESATDTAVPDFTQGGRVVVSSTAQAAGHVVALASLAVSGLGGPPATTPALWTLLAAAPD